jgi:quinol monooxygenase YgiN
MSKLGLFVRLEAKPGKEKAVAEFLKSALSLAVQENYASTWYAFQIDEKTFGIFDTFTNEHGRTGHLNGKIAQQLMVQPSELFANELVIEKLDILAAK